MRWQPSPSRKNRTPGRRRTGRGAAALLLALAAAPLLQGCLAGLILMQAVPVAVGGVAMSNAPDRSPFITRMPHGGPRPGGELEALDAHLRAAACGDAASQFWVATALRNDFNATPDEVEIYKWYGLAERGAYAPAAAELAVLDARMSEAARAEARARIQAWRPEAENCARSG